MSYSDAATKGAPSPIPTTKHKVTHHVYKRFRQIILQIINKMTVGCPTDTQDYINYFCHK